MKITIEELFEIINTANSEGFIEGEKHGHKEGVEEGRSELVKLSCSKCYQALKHEIKKETGVISVVPCERCREIFINAERVIAESKAKKKAAK